MTIAKVNSDICDPLLCFTEEEASEEGDEKDIMQVLGGMVMAMLVKYWVYICGGMFFFVSFEGTIVMYKIIYMVMFLSCVAVYQVKLTKYTPVIVSVLYLVTALC